jgi:hypothetical protein
MPRLMSVAFTEQAVRERRKTVTRRLGWRALQPGDELDLCRKVMGRRQGEPLIRVARVRVTSVRRESLSRLTTLDPEGNNTPYALQEVTREGLPELNPQTFVDRYFTQAQGVSPDTVVTRIEWEYLPTPDVWPPL